MKDEILKYLRTVSSATAKTIAERIGADRFDVARELNALHAEGTVEREKRNGNEYAYWLTLADGDHAVALAAAARPAPAVEPEAPATAVTTVSVDDLALQILMLKNQIIDLGARREADAVERLQIETERDELKVENESLKEAVAKLCENNHALEQRIDTLTLGPLGAKSPLFVTVGRYAKPARHTSIERAQRRAAALVRCEKESEVLVLEPVGRVVRGSEWRPV